MWRRSVCKARLIKINGYTSYSLNGEERYLSYLTTEIPDWYMMVLMPESALRTQSHVIQKNGVMLTFKLTAVMACLMSIIFIIRHREELSTHKVLQEAAMMDGLTHIYNRGAVELMLTDLLEKSHESSYALFLMDVDAFKQINDTYGHIVGDDVLIALAQHLRELFDEEALLGRMGGDEFIALLQYHGNKEEVICKAREITVSFFTGSEAPSVSVSIGISLYPEDGVSFHTLYQKADKALYDTKRQGKNSFTFYKGE